MSGGEILSKRFILLILALAAALLAGCGDDEAGGDEGPITTSSLSKEEYVQEANKICVDSREETSREVGEALGEGEAAELAAALVDIAAEGSQSQHDAMRELGAPEGSEQQVEAMLVEMQRSIDEAEEKSIESLPAYAEEFGQYDKLARKYGLDRCVFGA